MLRPIETITDLIEHARKHSGFVDKGTLYASGLGSIGAVAGELRRRGYEVAVYLDDRMSPDGIRILAPPIEGARRRLKDQTSLLPEPTPERPAGFGDPEA